MAATEILKPGDVPSPCINFCRLDRDGVLCLGCFRSLDEIINWSALTPAQKRAVLDALPARQATISK
jgi:hypothetical protein